MLLYTWPDPYHRRESDVAKTARGSGPPRDSCASRTRREPRQLLTPGGTGGADLDRRKNVDFVVTE